MAKGSESRYGIKIDSNAAEVGLSGATALEQLRQRIASSEQAVKGYTDSLRRLRGNSDQVKDAKAALTAKINAERTAISQSTLQVLKAGSSYDKLTSAHKRMTEEAKKGAIDKLARQHKSLGGAIDAVGGPVAELKNKFAGLTDILGGADGAMGILAVGAVATVAALAVVGAAIGGLIAKFAEWVLVSGDALRSQQLTREAFVGNTADAKRLGDQIDALGKKVPTTRAALNDMANDLVQAGLSGQTLVDTLNATAQASAALGGSAGKQISSFIERGKLSGRFSLGQQETQGTGIKFQDVAAALAKNTKTSVAEASQALQSGQVSLGEGAKALRDAIEKRFGDVNLAKKLSLGSLKDQLTDSIQALTKNVNIEPVLQGFGKLVGLLDSSTQSGAALQTIVTDIGNAMSSTFASALPSIKSFFEVLILNALKLDNQILELELAWQDAFGDKAIGQLGDAAGAIAGMVGPLGDLINPIKGFSTALQGLTTSIETIKTFGDLAKSVYSKWVAIPWGDIGASIVAGIVGPMDTIVDKARDVGRDIVKALRGELKINSPSKVLEKEVGEPMGEGMAKGIPRGVEKGGAHIDQAVGSMAGGGGPGGGGTVININAPVHVEGLGGGGKGGGEADIIARVRAEVLLAIELGLRQAGFAPQ